MEHPGHNPEQETGGPKYKIERIFPDSEKFDEAKHLEFQVFAAHGLVSEEETNAQELTGYESYDKSSVFNAVTDDRGKIIGVLREIRPGPAGLRTLKDFQEIEGGLNPEAEEKIGRLDPEKILEIGTLAVSEEHRGRAMGVAMRLYGMMLKNSQENGFEYWVSTIDQNLLDTYRHNFGFDFEPIGPSREYFGHIAVPVLGERDKILENVKKFPEVYQKSVLGVFEDGKVEY